MTQARVNWHRFLTYQNVVTHWPYKSLETKYTALFSIIFQTWKTLFWFKMNALLKRNFLNCIHCKPEQSQTSSKICIGDRMGPSKIKD